MPLSHLILGHPLLLLLPVPPSIRLFSNESTLCMRWPKYWSFSFSIIPSKDNPGMISFRMDWLALLAVQGTLKSLFQNHSSKASIPQCSVFFTVQLSHPYMTTGKTIGLTRRTFVGKVMGSCSTVQETLFLVLLCNPLPAPPASCHLLESHRWSRVCSLPAWQWPPGWAFIPGFVRVLTLGRAGGHCAHVQLVCPHQRGR